MAAGTTPARDATGLASGLEEVSWLSGDVGPDAGSA